MDLAALVERLGEARLLPWGGAAIGLLFGLFAQRSGFCLRGAVVEFARGRPGAKLSVWLLSFASALVAVQVLRVAGWLDVAQARQLANRGSLSGALVGGLLFGAGMVLTRGCASRLLVLAATGNLRALLSGLVFAVTAQAALGGALAPAREAIAGWWTVEGGAARDLLAITGLGPWGGLAVGGLWLAAALWYGVRNHHGAWTWIGGLGAGLAVAAAWAWTGTIASQSFAVVPVQGLSFSGPSAEWLMRVLAAPVAAPGFDTGMLPGVFAGSLLGALWGREWQVVGFGDGYSLPRYIAGAVAMGFGAMLAGGCAVGAGVTGGAVFALTAWVALVGMWAGGAAMDRVVGDWGTGVMGATVLKPA